MSSLLRLEEVGTKETESLLLQLMSSERLSSSLRHSLPQSFAAVATEGDSKSNVFAQRTNLCDGGGGDGGGDDDGDGDVSVLSCDDNVCARRTMMMMTKTTKPNPL
jgi:hypothetical protein